VGCAAPLASAVIRGQPGVGVLHGHGYSALLPCLPGQWGEWGAELAAGREDPHSVGISFFFFSFWLKTWAMNK